MTICWPCRTSTVVSALVQHIIRSWREHFARAVAMKFNCFFLMPFVDEFPFYLRQELDRVYEGDMAHLFDITEVKAALRRRRDDLIAECKANQRLQGKFDVIDTQMRASKFALDDDDSEDEEGAYYHRDGSVEEDVLEPTLTDHDEDSPPYNYGDVGLKAPPSAASSMGGGGDSYFGAGKDPFSSSFFSSSLGQPEASTSSGESGRRGGDSSGSGRNMSYKGGSGDDGTGGGKWDSSAEVCGPTFW